MVRFYSNENLPLALVEALRQLNYDILTSLEAGNANQGILDNEVLADGIALNRTIITLNRDDFIALHRSGINHSGIIICKDDRDYLGQAQALHGYLATQEKNLENCLIRVQKQNQPKSVKQFFVIREYAR